jgi:hypothetical protein
MHNMKRHNRAQKAFLFFITILYVFVICCIDLSHICIKKIDPLSQNDGTGGNDSRKSNHRNSTMVCGTGCALSELYLEIGNPNNCPACFFKNLHNITASLSEDADFGSFSTSAYLSELFSRSKHPIAQKSHIRAPPIG